MSSINIGGNQAQDIYWGEKNYTTKRARRVYLGDTLLFRAADPWEAGSSGYLDLNAEYSPSFLAPYTEITAKATLALDGSAKIGIKPIVKIQVQHATDSGYSTKTLSTVTGETVEPGASGAVETSFVFAELATLGIDAYIKLIVSVDAIDANGEGFLSSDSIEGTIMLEGTLLM